MDGEASKGSFESWAPSKKLSKYLVTKRQGAADHRRSAMEVSKIPACRKNDNDPTKQGSQWTKQEIEELMRRQSHGQSRATEPSTAQQPSASSSYEKEMEEGPDNLQTRVKSLSEKDQTMLDTVLSFSSDSEESTPSRIQHSPIQSLPNPVTLSEVKESHKQAESLVSYPDQDVEKEKSYNVNIPGIWTDPIPNLALSNTEKLTAVSASGALQTSVEEVTNKGIAASDTPIVWTTPPIAEVGAWRPSQDKQEKEPDELDLKLQDPSVVYGPELKYVISQRIGRKYTNAHRVMSSVKRDRSYLAKTKRWHKIMSQYEAHKEPAPVQSELTTTTLAITDIIDYNTKRMQRYMEELDEYHSSNSPSRHASPERTEAKSAGVGDQQVKKEGGKPKDFIVKPQADGEMPKSVCLPGVSDLNIPSDKGKKKSLRSRQCERMEDSEAEKNGGTEFDVHKKFSCIENSGSAVKNEMIGNQTQFDQHTVKNTESEYWEERRRETIQRVRYMVNQFRPANYQSSYKLRVSLQDLPELYELDYAGLVAAAVPRWLIKVHFQKVYPSSIFPTEFPRCAGIPPSAAFQVRYRLETTYKQGTQWDEQQLEKYLEEWPAPVRDDQSLDQGSYMPKHVHAFAAVHTAKQSGNKLRKCTNMECVILPELAIKLRRQLEEIPKPEPEVIPNSSKRRKRKRRKQIVQTQQRSDIAQPKIEPIVEQIQSELADEDENEKEQEDLDSLVSYLVNPSTEETPAHKPLVKKYRGQPQPSLSNRQHPWRYKHWQDKLMEDYYIHHRTKQLEQKKEPVKPEPRVPFLLVKVWDIKGAVEGKCRKQIFYDMDSSEPDGTKLKCVYYEPAEENIPSGSGNNTVVGSSHETGEAKPSEPVERKPGPKKTKTGKKLCKSVCTRSDARSSGTESDSTKQSSMMTKFSYRNTKRMSSRSQKSPNVEVKIESGHSPFKRICSDKSSSQGVDLDELTCIVAKKLKEDDHWKKKSFDSELVSGTVPDVAVLPDPAQFIPPTPEAPVHTSQCTYQEKKLLSAMNRQIIRIEPQSIIEDVSTQPECSNSRAKPASKIDNAETHVPSNSSCDLTLPSDQPGARQVVKIEPTSGSEEDNGNKNIGPQKCNESVQNENSYVVKTEPISDDEEEGVGCQDILNVHSGSLQSNGCFPGSSGVHSIPVFESQAKSPVTVSIGADTVADSPIDIGESEEDSDVEVTAVTQARGVKKRNKNTGAGRPQNVSSKEATCVKVKTEKPVITPETYNSYTPGKSASKRSRITEDGPASKKISLEGATYMFVKKKRRENAECSSDNLSDWIETEIKNLAHKRRGVATGSSIPVTTKSSTAQNTPCEPQKAKQSSLQQILKSTTKPSTSSTKASVVNSQSVVNSSATSSLKKLKNSLNTKIPKLPSSIADRVLRIQYQLDLTKAVSASDKSTKATLQLPKTHNSQADPELDTEQNAVTAKLKPIANKEKETTKSVTASEKNKDQKVANSKNIKCHFARKDSACKNSTEEGGDIINVLVKSCEHYASVIMDYVMLHHSPQINLKYMLSLYRKFRVHINHNLEMKEEGYFPREIPVCKRHSKLILSGSPSMCVVCTAHPILQLHNSTSLSFVTVTCNRIMKGNYPDLTTLAEAYCNIKDTGAAKMGHKGKTYLCPTCLHAIYSCHICGCIGEAAKDNLFSFSEHVKDSVPEWEDKQEMVFVILMTKVLNRQDLRESLGYKGRLSLGSLLCYECFDLTKPFLPKQWSLLGSVDMEGTPLVEDSPQYRDRSQVVFDDTACDMDDSSRRKNDTLSATDDNPLEIDDSSLASNETPLEMDDTPLDNDSSTLGIDDTPVEITDTSLEIEETPLEIKDKPINIDDEPLAISDTPLEINDKPIEIDDGPLVMNDTPLEIKDTSFEDEDTALVIDDSFERDDQSDSDNSVVELTD